jgi:tripartite-type tricarboxylate transporter receptor subunit TctC
MSFFRPPASRLAVLALACGVFLAPAAWSQTINKTARLVLGFPPGGSADVVARLVAERLRGVYAPNVIVDNRPGAGGRTAAEHVKAADPDGSTVLMTPSGMLTVFPRVYRSLGYDTFRDFAPVTSAASLGFAVTAGPALPQDVRTFPQFLKWARANPNAASYASPGAGSAPHFAGIMLAHSSGVSLTHVPYKGAQPMVQDLLGGQIAVGIVPISDALPHVRAGKLRALASTGAQRTRFFKDVPTAMELGFRDIDVETQLVIVVPAKVPARVTDRLGTLIRAGQQSTEVQERIVQLGMDPRASTAGEVGRFLRADYDRWARVVKASGFKADY